MGLFNFAWIPYSVLLGVMYYAFDVIVEAVGLSGGIWDYARGGMLVVFAMFTVYMIYLSIQSPKG